MSSAYSMATFAHPTTFPATYRDVVAPTSEVKLLPPLTQHGYQRLHRYQPWRVPNDPPICYYCGIPGQITRFCRRYVPRYDDRPRVFRRYEHEL